MSSSCSRFSLLIAVAALAAAAVPAQADWLVFKDGARLETRGPWRVEGRQVIFTLPNGTLSALRAEEVDLDRSAVVTARAVEAETRAEEPTPAPKREPVYTLTERDIPPSHEAELPPDSEESSEEGEGGEAAEQTGSEAPVSSNLEVLSWDKVLTPAGDGLQVAGTLKNVGRNTITSPSLVAVIYDRDGRLLATAEGAINAGLIQAGRTANFRVSFPGVTDFVAIKFDAQGRGFRENAKSAAEDEAPYESEEGAPR